MKIPKVLASWIQGYIKRITYCIAEFIVKLWRYPNTWKISVINSIYITKRMIMSILKNVERAKEFYTHDKNSQ